MKPISKTRKSRSVFRFGPHLVRLAAEKSFVPDPESAPTAIIFYFYFYFGRRLQATLLSAHQAHCSIAHLTPPIDAIENP